MNTKPEQQFANARLTKWGSRANGLPRRYPFQHLQVKQHGGSSGPQDKQSSRKLCQKGQQTRIQELVVGSIFSVFKQYFPQAGHCGRPCPHTLSPRIRLSQGCDVVVVVVAAARGSLDFARQLLAWCAKRQILVLSCLEPLPRPPCTSPAPRGSQPKPGGIAASEGENITQYFQGSC